MADAISPVGRRRADVWWAIAVTAALSIMASAGQGDGTIGPLAYIWAAGFGALMLLRRQHPVLVLTLSILGLFSYYAAGLPAIGVAVPVAAALVATSEAGRLRAAIIAAIVVMVVSTGFRVADGSDAAYVMAYEAVTHGALIAAAIALGDSLRSRRIAEARGLELTTADAVQAELVAEQRVRDERLNTAGELHDSIGHSLVVAGLHADVAAESIAGLEPAASQALARTRTAVREALDQLRSTVHLLRTGTGTGDSDPGAPDRDLNTVVRNARSAGLTVEIAVDDLASVPAPARTALVRVVQEAVTNTIRHADASHVSIRVRREASDVIAEVRDDGDRSDRPRVASSGTGLAGLRKRVEALGGELQAGPQPTGWTVTAHVGIESGQ